jgi:hypothetical protein
MDKDRHHPPDHFEMEGQNVVTPTTSTGLNDERTVPSFGGASAVDTERAAGESES